MAAHTGSIRPLSRQDILEALARIPVPAFAFDLSTLHFITANERFQHLTGYSLSELRDVTAESIRPATDIAHFRQTLVGDVPQGFVRARFICKSGTLLNVKIHYWNIQSANDRGLPAKARVVVIEFWEGGSEEAP